MNEAGESRLAAAVRGSVTVALLARSVRGLRPSVNPIAPPDPASEAADLAIVGWTLAGSRLTGPVWRLLAAATRAWGDSETVRTLSGRRRRLEALSLQQRARAVGVALVAAGLADGLLSAADRRPASGYRWLMWGVLLAIGVLLASCAEAIEAAWPASRLAGRRR